MPALPANPSEADVSAVPPVDQAGAAARALAERVKTFHNFRAEIHGATWAVDADAAWSIRSQAECHAALETAGVPFKALKPARSGIAASSIVPAPVAITGPIDGVDFNRPTVSCELAHKMKELAALARRHGIKRVGVGSHYRTTPYTSFHTTGLALDIYAFTLDDGTVLTVKSDFVMTPGHETCQAPQPAARAARALLDLACDLHRSRIFQTVITPNYNPGHRDHFHVDARPDDGRFFLR